MLPQQISNILKPRDADVVSVKSGSSQMRYKPFHTVHKTKEQI